MSQKLERSAVLAVHADTGAEIRRRLTENLEPELLELIDDSKNHIGHRGNSQHGGHYFLTITAAAFSGKSLLERQRIVFDLVADLMEQKVHALSMKCRAPGE